MKKTAFLLKDCSRVGIGGEGGHKGRNASSNLSVVVIFVIFVVVQALGECFLPRLVQQLNIVLA